MKRPLITTAFDAVRQTLRRDRALLADNHDQSAVLLPLLPVLLVALWVIFWPLLQPTNPANTASPSFGWAELTLLALQWLPLFLAQGLVGRCWQQPDAGRLRLGSAMLLWLGVMALYPALLLYGSSWAVFSRNDWLLVLGLSLLYWLHLGYQQQLQQNLKMPWLWSLDAMLLLALLLWVLSWVLLLVSHPPGLAEQPIPVRLDQARILAHPGLLLQYLWQLLLMAAVIFGCYWFNRYWLMRRILARHGLLPYILLSLCLMLLSYAPLAMLLLQLPMNQVEVPAVPAGNHDPFDIYNLNFMFLQWLLSTPVILAFERQQQERRLAQIQHQQIHTELQLLQQQINPHFLFNTLNNLYALCLTKSDQAPELVLRLADLLRYVVYQGQQARVTLAQELAYLQHYLALQQLRVSHKTSVSIDFPTEARHWQLPPLLLIMLLENAYKHGVESCTTPSWIQLSVKVEQQRLYFSCRNSLNAQSTAGQVAGVGLANLTRRLQLQYGSDFVLRSVATGDGWLAELQLELEPC